MLQSQYKTSLETEWFYVLDQARRLEYVLILFGTQSGVSRRRVRPLPFLVDLEDGFRNVLGSLE